MAKALSAVKHRTEQLLYMNSLQRRFALQLGHLVGVVISNAGVGPPSDLVTVLNQLLLGHLQVYSLVLLFRLQFSELGLYLGGVNVGVEIGHDGKDNADDHQQGGKEDILGPLVKKTNTHTNSDSIGVSLGALNLPKVGGDDVCLLIKSNKIHPPDPRASRPQRQWAQWCYPQQQLAASQPAAPTSCCWVPTEHKQNCMLWQMIAKKKIMVSPFNLKKKKKKACLFNSIFK